jgi:nucleoside-diphosphate-sugar epimerase
MKLVAEKLHQYYSEKYNIPVVCLRFSNIYGPTMKKGVFYHFIHDIVTKGSATVNGNGEQKRSFVYINDALSALLNALEYPCTGYEVFNISAETTTSMNELIEKVQKSLGSQAPVQHKQLFLEEESFDAIDITKAKKKLGYKPTISLEEGIALASKTLHEKMK